MKPFNALTFCVFFLIGFNLLAQQTHVVTNLNDSGAGSLRQMIAGSSDGDIITFSPTLLANGSATITLTSEIAFNRSLTIKGLFVGNDSLSISGGGTSSIFRIDGSTFALPVSVFLEDLILEDGYKNGTSSQQGYGAAIYGFSSEKISLKNMVLRGNTITGPGSGGAIYLDQVDTLDIQNSVFHQNTVDTIGNTISLGGAIRTQYCNLLIKHSTFKDNSSNFLGGALSSIFGSAYIYNSYWVENSAGHFNALGISSQRGGAISAYSLDTFYVFTSIFSSNIAHVSGPNSGGEGGAIYLDDSNGLIINSSFNLNQSIMGDGGAIRSYVQTGNPRKKLVIEDCIFKLNSAEKGGAIDFLNMNVCLMKCQVEESNADEGGAIFAYNGGLIIAKSTFVRNNATQNGSLLFLRPNVTANIVNSTFLDSTNTNLVYFQSTSSSQTQSSLSCEGSIMVSNNSITNNFQNIASIGHNIFSGNPSFKIATDLSGVSLAALQLKPLGNYGGFTESMPPTANSPALNSGNPTDFSPAQNGAIFGRRDCGAAEAQVTFSDTATLCRTFNWQGNVYNSPGFYVDTVFNANSIDSVGYLYLQGQDSSVLIQNGWLLAPLRMDTTTAYQWVYCDSNYAPVVGATDYLFKPTVNGNYAVISTNSTCIDTSACIAYGEVSLVERVLDAPALTLYPNPTRGKVHIETALLKKELSLSIYDLNGRLLRQERDIKAEIDLEHLPSGVYILSWQVNNKLVQRDYVILE